MSISRVIFGIGVLVLILPAYLKASSFKGKLFFTADERTAIERLLEEKPRSEKPTIRQTKSRLSVRSNSGKASHGLSTLLSFDGVLEGAVVPKLMINKTLWSDKSKINGINNLRWHAGKERLLVKLKDGRLISLSIGQCLMANYRLQACASLSDVR